MIWLARDFLGARVRLLTPALTAIQFHAPTELVARLRPSLGILPPTRRHSLTSYTSYPRTSLFKPPFARPPPLWRRSYLTFPVSCIQAHRHKSTDSFALARASESTQCHGAIPHPRHTHPPWWYAVPQGQQLLSLSISCTSSSSPRFARSRSSPVASRHVCFSYHVTCWHSSTPRSNRLEASHQVPPPSVAVPQYLFN